MRPCSSKEGHTSNFNEAYTKEAESSWKCKLHEHQAQMTSIQLTDAARFCYPQLDNGNDCCNKQSLNISFYWNGRIILMINISKSLREIYIGMIMNKTFTDIHYSLEHIEKYRCKSLYLKHLYIEPPKLLIKLAYKLYNTNIQTKKQIQASTHTHTDKTI